MHFWRAVEDFRKCGPIEIREEGIRIFEEYLKDNAPHELNVTAPVKQKISMIFEDDHMDQLKRDTFDLAQRKLF